MAGGWRGDADGQERNVRPDRDWRVDAVWQVADVPLGHVMTEDLLRPQHEGRGKIRSVVVCHPGPRANYGKAGT